MQFQSIQYFSKAVGHPLTQLWKAGSSFLARMSHGAMSSKLLVKTQFQRGIRQSLSQLGWVEGISPEKLSMYLFYRMGSIILHV